MKMPILNVLRSQIDLESKDFGRIYFSSFPDLVRILNPHSAEKAISDPHYSITESTIEPYPPVLNDLAILHYCILKRKVVEVLEFGVGYSTKVMAHALKINEKAYFQSITKMRFVDPFKVNSLDNSKKYIKITKKSTPSVLLGNINFRFSKVRMLKFNGLLATEYVNMCAVLPELIYLDGPSQNGIKTRVNGLSTNGASLMPMACDLLIYEHFIKPGTLLIIDGRTANARFLLNNFQRNWIYEYLPETDQHFFELDEPPLGKWNMEYLKFVGSI